MEVLATVGEVFAILAGLALIGTFFGVLTLKLKKYKNYEGGFWIGFFLGFFGVLYCMGLPDKTKHHFVIKEKVGPNGKSETHIVEKDV